MPENKYMEFDKIGDTGKTEIWNVLAKRTNFILGQIKWYSPWRQYCFFPSPMSIFNNSCMSDIQDFIKGLMAERRIK